MIKAFLTKQNFLIHFAFLALAYLGLGLLGYAINFLDTKCVLQWDVYWYLSIRDNGYLFNPDVQSNTGFFPLFPLIWRWTGLGLRGIALFNLILFILGVAILARQFNIDKYVILFYLSLPTIFFNYVPYSEATFFFTCVLFLAGMKKGNPWLIAAGFFLSSMTRGTALFCIPALTGMGIYYLFRADRFRNLLRYGLYILSSLAGFFLVVLYQWKATGKWFAYTYQQVTFWDHGIRLPKFPFTDWFPYDNLWHDGFAVSLTMFAVLILGIAFFRNWFGKDQKLFHDDPAGLYSVFYLSGVLLYIFLFHPDHDGTSILSASRYVFCVPFTLVFFHKIWSEKIFLEKWMIPWTAVIILLLLFSTGLQNFEVSKIAQTPFLTLMYYVYMGAYIFLFFWGFRKKNIPLLAGLYAYQIVFQVFELYRFSNNHWVG